MESNNYAKKKKNLIKIALIVLGIVLLGGGVFWIRKKIGEKSENKETSPSYLELKTRLKTELAQAKNQLAGETEQAKRQVLEQRIASLETQIKNLSNTPPGGGGPPRQLPPGNSQKFTIVLGSGTDTHHLYLSVKKNQKAWFLIAKTNPIFASGTDLDTPQKHYIISFKEEDATEKKIFSQPSETVTCYTFDENNTNFQLIVASKQPLPGNRNDDDEEPEPEPDDEDKKNRGKEKIEKVFECEGEGVAGEELGKIGFSNEEDGVFVAVMISKDNRVFKGKKLRKHDVPKCQISFLKEDASKVEEIEGEEEMKGKKVFAFFFEKDNNNFTLTPLGDWKEEKEGEDNDYNPRPSKSPGFTSQPWGSWEPPSDGPRPDNDRPNFSSYHSWSSAAPSPQPSSNRGNPKNLFTVKWLIFEKETRGDKFFPRKPGENYYIFRERDNPFALHDIIIDADHYAWNKFNLTPLFKGEKWKIEFLSSEFSRKTTFELTDSVKVVQIEN